MTNHQHFLEFKHFTFYFAPNFGVNLKIVMPEKNSKTQFYFTIIVISGWKPQLLHATLHNQINSNQIKKMEFLHMLLIKIAKVVTQLQSSVVFQFLEEGVIKC